MTHERVGDVDPFFDVLKDWSEIKLRILEKYFRGYLNFHGAKNPYLVNKPG